MEDDQFWPKRPVGVVNSKNEGAWRFERNPARPLLYNERRDLRSDRLNCIQRTAELFTKRVCHREELCWLPKESTIGNS